MKKFFLLVLVLFFAGSVFSNSADYGGYSITGRVSGSNGTPLVGASVVIENTLLGVYTGKDGGFAINGLRSGSYVLVVSYMGYDTKNVKVDVNGGNVNMNVTLEESSLMCDEVVVSSTRANTRMPIAQSTMNKEDVKNNNTYDVPYLLEMMPSVVATSEGGTGIGNTSLRIRGTDMTRINVTVNGIPLNDAESQGVYWVDLPDFASSVDNVQVQRGVGTSTNGAGAFGATVNFQTTTLDADPYAGVDLLGGSYNTLKTTARIGSGLIDKHFTFDGRYSQIHSDGYIERGGSDHKSMFASAAYHDEKNIVRFNAIYGEEHTAITWEGNPSNMLDVDRRYNPAGEYTNMFGETSFYNDQKDNYWQTHYQLLATHSFSENLSFNAALHLTTGKGYYEEYKDDKSYEYYGLSDFIEGNDTLTSGDFIHRKWMKNNFYGAIFSLIYRYSSFEFTFGGAWNRYDGDHFGRIIWAEFYPGLSKNYEWYRNNSLKIDWNTYAKANWQILDQLSMFADVQVRGVNYKLKGIDSDLYNLDQDHDWTFFNPKFGFTYSLNASNQIYSSFSVAHREPARSDLKDALKGTDNFVPKPETLYDYELGYKLSSTTLAFNANLYYMRYKDQLVLTGELTDVGYAVMANVPNSYRAGIELSLGVKPADWMSIELNTTLSKNVIKNYTNYLDVYDNSTDWTPLAQEKEEFGETTISFSPSVIGYGKVSFIPFDNCTFSWISKYVGKQYIDNTQSSERMLDAYWVNNLSVGYKLALKGTKSVLLQCMVNNILNESYISNAWIYRAKFADSSPDYIEDGYYPQATSNFLVRLGIEF